MDFSFTSEQDQLRDTVAKLIAQKYDFDTRRKVAKSEAGWRPEMWSQFAELGLLGRAGGDRAVLLDSELAGAEHQLLAGGDLDAVAVGGEWGMDSRWRKRDVHIEPQ